MLNRIEGLACEVEEGVAWLTMDRPDRLNALTHEMMDGLPQLLAELAEDQGVRCVVLAGAGKAFCAGGDISTAQDPGELSKPELVERFRRRQRATLLLHEMPKPTLAMIPGVAAGAGLSLALACDVRIAGPRARFATSFVKVAFSGDYGASFLLQRLVGQAKARELMFTGDVIDAREAERLGLVNSIAGEEQLRQEVGDLARRIADGPPVALARMKQTMNRALTAELSEVLELEAVATVDMMDTADNAEAMKAFFDKRPPVFTGR